MSDKHNASFAAAIDPLQWTATLSAPPCVALRSARLASANVRRWAGTESMMEQPRLTHHYVVMHLGGPKRVRRTGDGGTVVQDAPLGALTIVPAGSEYRWHTQGPIDFAHVYIDPRRLSRTAADVFDRDPARFSLASEIGTEDRLLAATYEALLAGAGETDYPMYLETVFEFLLVRLVVAHGNLHSVRVRAPYALAPTRLRAVRDYVEANFAQEVTLDDLARVAGLSRFHFNRAFRRAVGVPPYVYVTNRRIAEAKRRLRDADTPIGGVATACGYRSGAQFASAFRRLVGVAPSDYRANL